MAQYLLTELLSSGSLLIVHPIAGNGCARTANIKDLELGWKELLHACYVLNCYFELQTCKSSVFFMVH